MSTGLTAPTNTQTPVLTITTVAGTGTATFGGDDGPATSAQLNGPTGVAVDSAGALYLADYGNHRIRKTAAVRATGLPVTGTVVSWANVRSGLQLEVYRESPTEGVPPPRRDHQRWRLTVVDQDNGHDIYTIKNIRSGKVLEGLNARTETGAIVVQRTYGAASARHQQWTLIPINPDPTTDPVYKIVNRNSGLALHATTNAPTVIKQGQPYDDDGRQQRRLIPTSTQ